MQLFGDLDILSFVRISRLNSIGNVNRRDSKTKVIQLFKNSHQGNGLRDDQKTDDGIVYKQILIRAKLRNGKRGKTTELTGSSSLRRRS